jgi:Concanavalin A-like lectin/glucanases superfamily
MAFCAVFLRERRRLSHELDYGLGVQRVLRKVIWAEGAVAIALAPLLVLSACATAFVGDGEDAGRPDFDATARSTGTSNYGQGASDAEAAQSEDDAHADAKVAFDAGIPRDALVGEWLFSDNLNDTSGNGYDGTATGATFGVDRFGTANAAAVFNGVNQYISIANETAFALTGDVTVSAWINPTDFPVLAGIVSKCQGSSCSTFTFRLGYSSPYSYIDLDSAAVATGVPGLLTAGSWQHVAAVMSGTTATIYINGVSVLSHPQGFTPQVTSNTLRIGVDYPTRFFNGSIDDVRIYTRALSSVEIAALAADK